MKSEEKSLFKFFFFICPTWCKISTSKKNILYSVDEAGRLEKYLERWKRMQNQFKRDKKLLRRVKQIRQGAISQ